MRLVQPRRRPRAVAGCARWSMRPLTTSSSAQSRAPGGGSARRDHGCRSARASATLAMGNPLPHLRRRSCPRPGAARAAPPLLVGSASASPGPAVAPAPRSDLGLAGSTRPELWRRRRHRWLPGHSSMSLHSAPAPQPLAAMPAPALAPSPAPGPVPGPSLASAQALAAGRPRPLSGRPQRAPPAPRRRPPRCGTAHGRTSPLAIASAAAGTRRAAWTARQAHPSAGRSCWAQGPSSSPSAAPAVPSASAARAAPLVRRPLLPPEPRLRPSNPLLASRR